MKILCTGGGGFVGSHVVDLLIEQGHQVTILDNLSTGSMANVNEYARFICVDICDDLTYLFDQQFDYVYHFAAQINLRESIKDPLHDAKTNIMGSLNIMNQCVRTGVKKIIFASTGGAIYSPEAELPCHEQSLIEPASPYGTSKWTVENYLRLYNKLYGLNYTILRFSNVFGPGQNALGEAGVISIFINKALKSDTASVFGDGEQTRDFCDVFSVSQACCLAMEKADNQTLNVSTGKETSLNQIVEIMRKFIPLEVRYEAKIKGELYRSCLNNLLAKDTLGWNPQFEIEDGIRKTVEYYQERK